MHHHDVEDALVDEQRNGKGGLNTQPAKELPVGFRVGRHEIDPVFRHGFAENDNLVIGPGQGLGKVDFVGNGLDAMVVPGMGNRYIAGLFRDLEQATTLQSQ